MNLYDTVKRLCEERNISIRQLEQSVKFLPRYIYKWETSSPSIDKVIKVADYFGISLDELCERDYKTVVTKQSLYNNSLLELFSELNEQGQEIALNTLRGLAATPIYKNRPVNEMVERA